jgi:asparagine synthase (glutamine-hydrolysing)
VKKIPPGHILTYSKGSSRSEPYWTASFLQPSRAGESNLAKEFRNCFADAVSHYLKVDGNSNRIGTFLSGGVDSSTLTGIVTQLVGHSIKSFSIGFEEQQFNEIDYARIAAKAFGAEHHEYFVSPKDTYETIPILAEVFDEPYGNASAVPTYFCAKMALESGVDVLYGGDGGDELFAGNTRYATQKFFEYYQKIPIWLREPFIKPVIYALADGLEWKPLVRGKKYVQRASIPYHQRITSYDFFRVVQINHFLEDGLLYNVGRDYDPYAPFILYFFQAPARNNLDRHLYVDWRLTISDNDLLKFRMAEVAGVSVRFPFLDYRLAEFSLTVPAHIKMRGTRLRSFQKKAYADLLPPKIRTKKKHGFGLPIPVWLRTDRKLSEMMHDLVLSPRSIQRGYFTKKALEGLVHWHETDETSFYGAVLWNLMILELWLRYHWD